MPDHDSKYFTSCMQHDTCTLHTASCAVVSTMFTPDLQRVVHGIVMAHNVHQAYGIEYSIFIVLTSHLRETDTCKH